MINKDAILKAIREPMQQYYQDMTGVLGNWQPLERAAGILLEGGDARGIRTQGRRIPKGLAAMPEKKIDNERKRSGTSTSAS